MKISPNCSYILLAAISLIISTLKPITDKGYQDELTLNIQGEIIFNMCTTFLCNK